MQTINLDLSAKNIIPVLNVKQGDVGRKFKAVITDGGTTYKIPGDAVLSVWYSGTSGEGNYSMIGENSAFAIDGNTITVELITQMLNNRGEGKLSLVMNRQDGTQIGTWNITYVVEQLPGMGSAAAEQYFTALTEAATKAAESAARAEEAAAVGKALTAITSIPDGEDVDRLVTPGRYACETDERALTLLGCPVDKAFTLDVRYADGVGPHVGQELRPRDTGARLYRQFVDYSEILSEDAKALYTRVRGLKPQGTGYSGTPDTDWYDGSGDYTLTTPEELYGFAQLVNEGNTFAGETVRLGADIVVNNGDASTWSGETAGLHPWTPIGTSTSVYFAGTLDGQGHYISGLYTYIDRDSGLICFSFNATVKNLGIINSYFENYGRTHSNGYLSAQVLCAFVGRGYGAALQNLYTDARLVIPETARGFNTGGIAAFAKSNGTQNGVSYGPSVIDSCMFAGTITTNNSTDMHTGGILGSTDSSYATVKNCLNCGAISSKGNSYGGIVGRIYTGSEITDCVNAGTVNKAAGKSVGAVIGDLYGAGSFTVTSCYYPEDLGLELYGALSDSTASVTAAGNKALPAECTDNGMMPTQWAQVYDSVNHPTPLEIGADDYIVAQGTSGSWQYRKWASGIAECWYTHSFTCACATAWGSLYSDVLGNTYGRVGYPFTFAEVPQVQATLNTTSNGNNYAPWLAQTYFGQVRTAPGWRVVSPISISSISCSISIYAFGKWK